MSNDTVRLDDDKAVQTDNGSTVRISDDNTIHVGDGTVHIGDDKAVAGTIASSVVLVPGQTIVLNGENYTIESSVKSSGEAEVYTIKIDDNLLIFKHYKSNTPLSDTAKKVLSCIKNNPQDRIIKVIDFGKYNNQDYEIMEFAKGGTLDEYLREKPIHDEKKLKTIVRMINEGLLQLHDKHNVIYQDLKPDNILFTDAEKTNLVLADFGISSIMETGEKKATVVANLTDLYGALELSPKSSQKHVIARPDVDYYSLGITMMEMWMGEKPFRNIPAIERDDIIREERVDFPSDMPDDYKTLIQGLIKPNRKERWGDKQIQQWLKGETLQQAAGKAVLGYATEMFNDYESFSSPKELADLMVKYPDQGEKILYSGIAATWFEKSGRAIRAEEIKEVATTYANDKQSGYYAAIYKIDPGRAWISKGGKACMNSEEIAKALISESAYYMEELKKPNARLYLYLTAVEGSRGQEASENFRKYFTEYSTKRALSLVCIILQNRCITLGSTQYGSPEELAQEKSDAQITLIKREIMETDSLLLVWLSSFYNDKMPSANNFSQQPASGQFFLLGLFPYLSYKELDPSWQKNAAKILLGFINDSPGRADLFEAYAMQGLPFNDKLDSDAQDRTPIDYIVSNYSEISAIHSEYTAYNLISLLVKLGANVNTSRDTLLLAVTTKNVPLVKLLIDLGANTAMMNTAFKDITTKNNLQADKAVYKQIKPMLKPSGITKFLLVPAIIFYRKTDVIAGSMKDRAPSIIFSIICTLGIALGSWALLERVFKPGPWWVLGAATVLVIGSFLFIRSIVFKDGFRPVKIFTVLILTATGTMCFINIPKPADIPPFMERIWYGENGKPSPVPVELTIQTALVTSDALNFRASPSGSGELIKTLKKGDILTVTGKTTENGWIPVEHSGDPGYVSAEYISINAKEQTVVMGDNGVSSIAVESMTNNVSNTVTGVLTNIRSLNPQTIPFANSILNRIHSLGIFTIPIAIVVFIICFNIWRNKYRRSKITRFIAFCIGCLLIAFVGIKVTPIIKGLLTTQTATVTIDSLNMRSAPSTSGNIIKTLKKGDTLTLTGGTENGWAPVKHNGDSGYVSAEYITTSSSNSAASSSTSTASPSTSTTSSTSSTTPSSEEEIPDDDDSVYEEQ
jgi:serine/threonine protein kinase